MRIKSFQTTPFNNLQFIGNTSDRNLEASHFISGFPFFNWLALKFLFHGFLFDNFSNFVNNRNYNFTLILLKTMVYFLAKKTLCIFFWNKSRLLRSSTWFWKSTVCLQLKLIQFYKGAIRTDRKSAKISV